MQLNDSFNVEQIEKWKSRRLLINGLFATKRRDDLLGKITSLWSEKLLELDFLKKKFDYE